MHIAVYCGSVSGKQEIYTEKAALFGRWMAEQGHVLIYGGAQGGLMGAVSKMCIRDRCGAGERRKGHRCASGSGIHSEAASSGTD